VTLELGGKSANIVFADADFDAALEGALTGNFLQQRAGLPSWGADPGGSADSRTLYGGLRRPRSRDPGW
jgi:hypothetical protein